MGTTLNKLEYLDETKSQIKTALNQFNAGITDEDTFRSYVDKIDDIYDNWEKVTGEGTEVTLTPTKKGRLALIPKGNSTQVTTTGKNYYPPLLNKNQTIRDITAVYSDETGKITLNGTISGGTGAFADFYSVGDSTNYVDLGLTAGTYYISGLTDGSNSTIAIVCAKKDTSNNVTYNTVTTSEVTMQVNTGDTFRIFIRVLYPLTLTNKVISPMISKTANDTFEKYTGGIPSPNPDYPQEIKTVTGNQEVVVKNKNIVTSASVYNSTLIRIYVDKPIQKTLTLSAILPNDLNGSLNLVVDSGSSISLSTITGTANQKFTKTFTLTDAQIDAINNGTNVEFRIYQGGASFTTISEVMIEYGSTATPYVPHAEQTVTFPLSTGQKLMLRDTLEDDGIHHKRIYTRINPNDNWIKNGTRYELDLDNYSNGKHTILCSHFVEAENWTEHTTSVNNTIILYKSASWDKARISINTNDFSTLNEFKQFITDNNVYVEYELATETTEAYTTAQQTAYNNLQKMQSYNDTTIITSTNTEGNEQMIINASALKKGSE